MQNVETITRPSSTTRRGSRALVDEAVLSTISWINVPLPAPRAALVERLGTIDLAI